MFYQFLLFHFFNILYRQNTTKLQMSKRGRLKGTVMGSQNIFDKKRPPLRWFCQPVSLTSFIRNFVNPKGAGVGQAGST